jgi:tetratricopeptide (TPR) repeat protein
MARALGPTLDKFVTNAIAEKAKALLAEGNQHFNAGELQPALDKYELAFRVKPTPAYQFNIAECHRKLGEYREAIASYEAYLAGVPRAKNREAVESTLAETQKQLADQQAQEQQHEQDRAATEQKQADDARKAQAADAERTKAERAKTERAEAEQAQLAQQAERTREAYNRHPARAWMLATTGLGLALGGAGAYYAVQASGDEGRFDALGCGDPQTQLDTMQINQCFSYRDRADSDGFMSKVLNGSGGAIVVASLIVLIADPGNIEPPRKTAVSITHNSVSFSVRW